MMLESDAVYNKRNEHFPDKNNVILVWPNIVTKKLFFADMATPDDKQTF